MEEMQSIETVEQTPMEAYLQKIFSKEGWATKLMTPVGRIKVADEETARALKRFLETTDVEETFRVCDLLLQARYEAKRIKEIRSMIKNGARLFLVDGTVTDAWFHAVLNSFSIRGICSLLTVCGGAELRVPTGMSAEDFAHSSFVFLREKDANAIRSAAEQRGTAKLIEVGTVIEPGCLRIVEWGKTLSYQLNELFPHAAVAMQLGDDCTEYFLQGRDAALGSYCSSGMPWVRSIRVAEELPFPQFMAAAIGLYDVWTEYRGSASVLRFATGTQVGFVVPRPEAVDGDVLYAFCPLCDEKGVPSHDQVERLRSFIADQYAKGNIKSVLPLKKNALSMIDRICGEELTYQPWTELPFGRFALLAIVPRGTEQPGTKLGVFQSR